MTTALAVTSKAKIGFKVTVLSPAMARELLEKNHPNNRKVKDHKVNQIFRDIEDGNGRLTFDPIVIDEDGWMVNGQHRCHAVILADEPIPVIILTHFPREGMLASDQGAKRTVGDIAQIMGRPLPHGSAQYSGVARIMMRGLSTKSANYSVQEVLNFIDRHEQAIEFSFECMPQNQKYITQSPVRAVIARAYYLKDSERVKSFCECLISGLMEHPKNDRAAIVLRNWLIDSFSSGIRSGGKGRPSPQQVYAKTERALRAFLDCEPIQKIQETSKELFPLP